MNIQYLIVKSKYKADVFITELSNPKYYKIHLYNYEKH